MSEDFVVNCPSGRVKPGRWATTLMARTVHKGGSEGLAAGWGRFDAWIKAEGLAPAGDLWERCLRGPESGLDAAESRTEFNRPLAN
ncbi:MAG: hypothetical protein WCC53_05550 [Thermoanaerobaculia bacterium]